MCSSFTSRGTRVPKRLRVPTTPTRVDNQQRVAKLQSLGPLESHASDADTDAVDTASLPESPRRQTLSPFVANNVHLRNAEPVTPLQSVEYPLVTVKKSSLYCLLQL